jgi:hypothetical protein
MITQGDIMKIDIVTLLGLAMLLIGFIAGYVAWSTIQPENNSGSDGIGVLFVAIPICLVFTLIGIPLIFPALYLDSTVGAILIGLGILGAVGSCGSYLLGGHFHLAEDHENIWPTRRVFKYSMLAIAAGILINIASVFLP